MSNPKNALFLGQIAETSQWHLHQKFDPSSKTKGNSKACSEETRVVKKVLQQKDIFDTELKVRKNSEAHTHTSKRDHQLYVHWKSYEM